MNANKLKEKLQHLLNVAKSSIQSNGTLIIKDDLAGSIYKTLKEFEVFIKNSNGSNFKLENLRDSIENSLILVKVLKVFSDYSLTLHAFSLNIFSSITELYLDMVPPSLVSGLFELRNKLKVLSIINSGITDLSQIFCPVENTILKTLSPLVFPNSNSNIPSQYLWPNLIYLRLSNCGISKMDESFHFFQSLEYLDLSFNSLSHIIHIQDCISLKSLIISHNKIKILSNLERVLGKIEVLDLSYNDIQSLDGIDKIYSLEQINLASNQIDDFGEILHLSKLPCLESIELNGNPISENPKYRLRVFKEFLSNGSVLQGNRNMPILDNKKIKKKERKKLRRVMFRRPIDSLAESSYADEQYLNRDIEALLDLEDDDYFEEDDEEEDDEFYGDVSPVSNENMFRDSIAPHISTDKKIFLTPPGKADGFKLSKRLSLDSHPNNQKYNLSLANNSPMKPRMSMSRASIFQKKTSHIFGTNSRDFLDLTAPHKEIIKRIRQNSKNRKKRLAFVADDENTEVYLELSDIENHFEKIREQLAKTKQEKSRNKIDILESRDGSLSKDSISSSQLSASLSKDYIEASHLRTSIQEYGNADREKPSEEGGQVISNATMDEIFGKTLEPKASFGNSQANFSSEKEPPRHSIDLNKGSQIDPVERLSLDIDLSKSNSNILNNPIRITVSNPSKSSLSSSLPTNQDSSQDLIDKSKEFLLKDSAEVEKKEVSTIPNNDIKNLTPLPVQEISSPKEDSVNGQGLENLVYVGDQEYKNLSVIDNLEIYFREQVFNSFRPWGPQPYLAKIKEYEQQILTPNLIDVPNVEERFITLYCEKVIDLSQGRLQLIEHSVSKSASIDQDKSPRISHLSNEHRQKDLKSVENYPKEFFTVIAITDETVYLIEYNSINPKLTFKDAPIPVVVNFHPLYTLSICTIFFGFQRCALSFHKPYQFDGHNSSILAQENAPNQYMIVTRDKSHTYPIITRIPPLANTKRNNRKPNALPNVKIENKDSQLLEQVMKYISSIGSDNDIIFYQMAYQTWKKKPGIKVPRTIILTQSFVLLCLENLDSINVSLEVLDSSSLKDVSKIYTEKNTLFVTIVFKPSNMFSSKRKWRLCTDLRATSSRLQEELKRACNEFGNTDI